MKKYILNAAFLAALIALAAMIFPAGGAANQISGDEQTSSDETSGKDMEEASAPVMKLKSSAAEEELNAIANLFEGESSLMAIDFGTVSGEFCMLESATKNYMIHFSAKPESTPEDIIYFISPDTFKRLGLRVKELLSLPTELGKMQPLRWYYYDGKSIEPHHGKRLHRDFLVMAIDVK